MTGFEPLLPAAAALAASAAKPLGDIMLEVLKNKAQEEGGNLFSRLLKRSIGQDVEQLIFRAAGEYIKSYAERHGTLKVLGMREPVNLEDVFTTVQFLAEDEVKRFATVEDLEKTFRELGQRFRNWSKERLNGMTAASEKPFLMVLGQPGAGKSTFLRKIGLEALKGKKGELKFRNIPVFLELKRFTENKIDVKALIATEFETCGVPKPKEFTESALKQGKLLILFDGLDEVPSTNINSVIDAIQDFVDRYDKNRYIASCRTAAYRYNFKRFSDVIISDFSDEQIQQFVNNWFRSEVDQQARTAFEFWELLNQITNRASKELAHTPLLLTFLCLVYDKSQAFPENRSELYEQALRILLAEWAAEKRIRSPKIYKGLNIGLEKTLLSEIAYAGFKGDRLFMPQKQLVEQISDFLTSNLNAPNNLDGEAVLDAIAIQQGVLVERTEAIYSFSHLTLQEYLTAQYIYDNGVTQKTVEQHLTDKRWREVFRLKSGLMTAGTGADKLLEEMHKAAQQQTHHPKVKALLQWADQVTVGSSESFKPAAKRARAISISISIASASDIARAISIAKANNISIASASDITRAIFIARASNIDITRAISIASNIDITRAISIDIARAISNAVDSNIDSDSDIARAISIARANDVARVSASVIARAISNAIDSESFSKLEQVNIFSDLDLANLVLKLQAFQAALESRNKEQILETAKQVEPAYIKAFKLTNELITWSKEDAEALNTYLYSIDLLLKCKEEAARLSLTTWEAIEQELLLPPADEVIV